MVSVRGQFPNKYKLHFQNKATKTTWLNLKKSMGPLKVTGNWLFTTHKT